MGSFSAEEYFYKLDNILLSSCQPLRKVFQKRYERITGQQWEHTEQQGKLFMESQDGEKIEKKANKLQKKIIERKYLEEWDISTLSFVLQHFGDPNLYRMKNEALKQLTKLRNKLAHHPTRKLSREEYNTNVDVFRENLQILSVESSEIEKIIVKAGVSSSVTALEATKELMQKGESCMKAEEFEKAVPFFDEATTMPSLLPVHEGAAYEKRAECYLKWANYLKQNRMINEADNCVEQALLDTTLALDLNDGSWQAHFLTARCHRWKNSCELAIQHYNRALAASPTQKHVKIELDSFKVFAESRKRSENVNPCNAPITLAEKLASFEEQTGTKLSEEQWIAMMKENTVQGQQNVFRGHQYMNGWSIPQNEQKAACHFAKAAKVGNAEGIYNLALCYHKGKGVIQDLEKAYELYLQAANLPLWKDDAVVSAQFSLGLMYHDGIFVEQDYIESAKWFEKAVDNGCGAAANNLGWMYFQGKGVYRNDKKAEMLWNQGVTLKSPTAAESLMNYYLQHMEPEKAKAMYQTGKELGSNELNEISEDQFNKMVESFFDRRIESMGKDKNQLQAELLDFERKHKVDAKGITFFERLKRKGIGNDSTVKKILQNIENAGSNTSWGGMLRAQGMDYETIEDIASKGSITAENVMVAVTNAVVLSVFLQENECETDDEKNYVLEMLYECCTGEFHVSSVWLHKMPIKDKVKKLIGQLFNSKCGEKGEDDMKIRFSYVCFNSLLAEKTEDTLWIEILKEGIKMYPDNIYYYDLLNCLYGMTGDPQSGLECCEKGLRIIPNNVELLYQKATHLRNLSDHHHLNKLKQPRNLSDLCHLADIRNFIKRSSSKETGFLCRILEAYNEYLAHTPPDHRKLPSAYYALAACIYMEEIYCGRDRSRVLDKVKHYFNLGKKAETKMLPCYLPYGETDIKRMVESVLLMAKAMKSSNFNQEISQPLSQDAPKNVLERKQYLTNPIRKQLLLHHRNHQNGLVFNEENFKNPIQVGTTFLIPKLLQTAPTKMSISRPITLSEMNPTCDYIFENRIIDFTIIDDPVFGYPSIHLIAEDVNGDVARLYLYNVEQNKEAAKNLAQGSTIAIMNPYMRIGSLDDKPSIRNDEPRCVLYLDKVEKMCWFCGEENAQRKCSKCKRVYCSRECQELDWKLLKHKLIC